MTDEDLHGEGAALIEDYRVVLTGTHPEYVSWEILDALEAYRKAGDASSTSAATASTG